MERVPPGLCNDVDKPTLGLAEVGIKSVGNGLHFFPGVIVDPDAGVIVLHSFRGKSVNVPVVAGFSFPSEAGQAGSCSINRAVPHSRDSGSKGYNLLNRSRLGRNPGDVVAFQAIAVVRIYFIDQRINCCYSDFLRDGGHLKNDSSAQGETETDFVVESDQLFETGKLIS
jgi:hypothetical protein